MYHKKEEKSIDPLGPQEVFSIHESELKGWTQCKPREHEWVKLNDNEVNCTKCPTVLIVNPDYLNELLK